MAVDKNVSAQEWFALGERVAYDHRAKRILGPDDTTGSQDVLSVFRRVVNADAPDESATWTTLLPGFPDGSFGWAKVDQYLAQNPREPMLYVEYVGQGESDKPRDYPYSTMERADLVEALWEAEGITSTTLVSFDYSSLVVLELLSRQLERREKGDDPLPRIEGVLLVNGGLFADAHSHTWLTTPVFKSPIGPMMAWVGQRSRFAFNQLLKPLFSKDYGVTSDELNEIYDAVSRRNGVAFVNKAAGFVDEHKANADRWDLRRLFLPWRDSVSFVIAGSEGDPLERNQIVKTRERLGEYGIDVRLLPGGHFTTSEQPELFAQMIDEL